MTEQSTDATETSPELAPREGDAQWIPADFVEQSACAEFSAYVFAD
ncbi:MAG: hypothetical protein WCJ30_02300 [Deltaproteobacteria bacterium]